MAKGLALLLTHARIVHERGGVLVLLRADNGVLQPCAEPWIKVPARLQ